MSKIWNWTIEGYNLGHADFTNVVLQSGPLPPGTNVFAQATITKFETAAPPFPAAAPGVQVWISRYAKHNLDGSPTSPISNSGNSGTEFIQNCAWVEIELSVRSARAIANLTLFEWN